MQLMRDRACTGDSSCRQRLSRSLHRRVIVNRLASVVLLVWTELALAQVATRERPRDADAAEERGPASKHELFARGRALMVEGTNVHLEDVVVRAKSGHLIRVASGRHEIFVAPPDPSQLSFLAIGAAVDVRGTLIKAPSAGQAQLIHGMGSREARRLSRQRVYVDAWSVTAIE